MVGRGIKNFEVYHLFSEKDGVSKCRVGRCSLPRKHDRCISRRLVDLNCMIQLLSRLPGPRCDSVDHFYFLKITFIRLGHSQWKISLCDFQK